MSSAPFVIWALTNPDDPLSKTMITTQLMLKPNARGINEELFASLEKNKQLLLWFWEHGMPQRKSTYMRIITDFAEKRFSSFEEAEQYFTASRLFEYFDLLEDGEANLPYLEGDKDSRDYLSAAERLTHSLPEPDRFTATAWIALNAMVLSIYPNDLPPRLLSAMMKPWRKAGFDPVVSITNDTCIHFGWTNLPADGPLQLRVIKNAASYPLALQLTDGDIWQKTILIPAHSQLHAIYAGKTMTCIKGALAANGHYAACLQEQHLFKYKPSEQRSILQPLIDPDNIHDLALAGNGGVHILNGSTASVQDISGQKNIPDCIGIYALDNVWVVLQPSGSTFSNIRRLCLTNVISAVQLEQDILLMTRDGSIHSLSRKVYTEDDFRRCMFSRFSDLPEDAVERILCCGFEILRTEQNKLVCQRKEL